MLTRSAKAGAAFFFLGLVAVSGFYGCQSTPAPILVGDAYTNIEYEYSLRIPRGWEPRRKLPTEFGYLQALPVIPEMCSLMLYNEKSGGLIAIMNNVNRIAYEEYFDISDAGWDERMSSVKATLEKDLAAVTFRHSVHRENLYTTQQNYFANQYAYKPEKVFEVNIGFEFADQKAHINFNSFLYPCRNTKTCETIVFLSCYDKDLAQNQPAFEALLASLHAHDYYD